MDSAERPDCFEPRVVDEREVSLHSSVPADAEAGISVLFGVFQRVCRDLGLEDGGSGPPAVIVRAILEAALDGEDDLENLYQVGLKSVAN